MRSNKSINDWQTVLYLEGATPTRFGPKPLNRALVPSVSTICRIHLQIEIVCFGEVVVEVVVVVRVGVRLSADCVDCDCDPLLKHVIDDCSRVFTTSNGHVIIAPIVPPTLALHQLIH